MKRRRGARPDLAGLLALAALAASLAAAPFSADAQVFLATKPAPAFTVGPLFLRGDVSPALGPVTVDVLWSLVLAPGVGPETAAQDLYLLWPTAVTGAAGGGADPELARYVEARGFAVIDEGRLPLFAESVRQAGGDASRETLAGGAPFVTFVLQGGPLGLSAPASYIRIPWTPKLVSRAWLVALRVTVRDLIAPKTAG